MSYREQYADRWVEGSIYCYSRGCRCEGCYMREIVETGCQMKTAVMELVRKFGKPNQEEKEFTAYEWKILNTIKDGNITIKEIADKMGKPESSIIGMIHQLYGKAKLNGWQPVKKGAVSKNLLPQFIKFVQSGGFDNDV